MSNYVQSREEGWFDETFRGRELDKMGDFLGRLDKVIDWKVFLPELEAILHHEALAPGGRPAYHPILKFKMLMLGKLYCLSDEQLEYQSLDRRSFSRFLGLSAADPVPDANTLREFRDKLGPAGVLRLFDRFSRLLKEEGMTAKEGHMIDATFVDVPRQRNHRQENSDIKEGRLPAGWEEDPKRLAHKDIEARWAKKGGETHFGYKDHVKVGEVTKFIKEYIVTDASVHDSQPMPDLVRQGDISIKADSAYVGSRCAQALEARGVKNEVMEKGARGRKLSKEQMAGNRGKSKVRVRVEHVFGFMTMTMRALYQRCVGGVRNETGIGLTNLVHNLCRYEQIKRLGLNKWGRWEACPASV